MLGVESREKRKMETWKPRGNKKKKGKGPDEMR
jgi:hypothetical protein